jgi:hypothetical protein
MFQIASGNISVLWRQLWESCGADKMCIFLRLDAKVSDRFLEQRINIRFEFIP